MKHRFLLLILLCLLPLIAKGSEQAGERPEDEWSYLWFGVVSPSDQDSFWLKRGNGKAEVREDGLAITTQDSEYLLYVITHEGSGGVWDGSTPQIIEFSARAVQIDGQNSAAAHLTVSDGTRCAAVKISGENDEAYRLEWINGNARLLVDGVERPELMTIMPVPPDHPYANSLTFGDDSGNAGGESLWRYIRWKPFNTEDHD